MSAEPARPLPPARIEVVRAPAQALVVDEGRHGWAHLAVACAGAYDRRSYARANRLVGNFPGAAALEYVLGPLVLHFAQAATLAVCGVTAVIELRTAAMSASDPGGSDFRRGNAARSAAGSQHPRGDSRLSSDASHRGASTPDSTAGTPHPEVDTPHPTAGTPHRTSASAIPPTELSRRSPIDPHTPNDSPHPTAGTPHRTSASAIPPTELSRQSPIDPHTPNDSPHPTAGTPHRTSGSAIPPTELSRRSPIDPHTPNDSPHPATDSPHPPTSTGYATTDATDPATDIAKTPADVSGSSPGGSSTRSPDSDPQSHSPTGAARLWFRGTDEAITVPAGTTVTIRPATAGLRGYVAVRGGFDVPATLGSRSADTLSGLGPAPLRAGDVLPRGSEAGPFPAADAGLTASLAARPASPIRTAPPARPSLTGAAGASSARSTPHDGPRSTPPEGPRSTPPDGPATLRVGPGNTTPTPPEDPHTTALSEQTVRTAAAAPTAAASATTAAQDSERVIELRLHPAPRSHLLLATPAEVAALGWIVAQDSNRIGLRLSGAAIPVAAPPTAASEPLVRGAVQVPPDGHPVIMGPDHPTTGGYPVIGVVAAEDCDVLAQARPGDAVRLLPTGTWPFPTAPAPDPGQR